MPNKFYAYNFNVESGHLVFLKTYNADLDDIIITCANRNDRSLEKEEKDSFTMLLDKYK